MSRLPVEACTVAYPHLAHDWRGTKSWARCRGIKIDSDTRAQPVATRRHVVAELRAVKHRLADKITRWAVSGVEYDGGRLVPRRVDDFPENGVDSWVQLTLTCRAAINELTDLMNYAAARGREVERHERRRGTG